MKEIGSFKTVCSLYNVGLNTKFCAYQPLVLFFEPETDACVAFSSLQNPNTAKTYSNATVIIKCVGVLKNRKSQRTIFAMT